MNKTIARDALLYSGHKDDFAYWKKLGIEGQADLINKYLTDKVYKPMKADTFIVPKDSIWAAPTYANMIARTPDIVSTPLWDALKGLPQDAKMDYNQIRTIGIDLIKQGKYGEVNTQAVERMVSDINMSYKQANIYVGTQRGLTTVFGIQPLVNSHRVETGAGMLDPRSAIVDAMKPAEVMRDVLREVIKDKVTNPFSSDNPFRN
jgi:hypothetical protein